MAHDDNHRPGEPPEIRDEAADTPMWLPALGLALLVVAALGLVYQTAQSEAEAAEAAEMAETDAEADGAEAGEAEPAEEPADDAPAE